MSDESSRFDSKVYWAKVNNVELPVRSNKGSYVRKKPWTCRVYYHGDLYRYIKKACRCELCRKAMKDYRSQLRPKDSNKS